MKNGSIIELRKLANLKLNSSSSNFPVLEIQINYYLHWYYGPASKPLLVSLMAIDAGENWMSVPAVVLYLQLSSCTEIKNNTSSK